MGGRAQVLIMFLDNDRGDFEADGIAPVVVQTERAPIEEMIDMEPTS